jgi:uncharacterized protein YecT (DUF1311 family)
MKFCQVKDGNINNAYEEVMASSEKLSKEQQALSQFETGLVSNEFLQCCFALE